VIDVFWEKYFIEPMGHYYTLPATIVYSLLFAAATFVVYKYILKKMKFKIDKKFMISLVPFIFLGGIMRALEDVEFYKGYFFVSPGIYLTVFSIAFVSLLLSLALQKITKKEYWKFMLVIGGLFCLYNLYQIFYFGFSSPRGVLMILGLVGFWTLIFGLIHLKFPKYLSRFNLPILISHLFDGSATFVALTYFGFMEQHVLPTFLINLTGPWIMFPLKILVVWPVLYYIDKLDDNELKIWLKIVVLILGLALGTRDMLKVGLLGV